MSQDEEPRYTLDQAKRALAVQECRRFGHEWHVEESEQGPENIWCSVCGETHRIDRSTPATI